MVQLDTTPTRSHAQAPKMVNILWWISTALWRKETWWWRWINVSHPGKQTNKQEKKNRCPRKMPGEYRERIEAPLLKSKVITGIDRAGYSRFGGEEFHFFEEVTLAPTTSSVNRNWNNRPFYSCVLNAWPLNRSDAEGDLVMLQTFLLFKCNK